MDYDFDPRSFRASLNRERARVGLSASNADSIPSGALRAAGEAFDPRAYTRELQLARLDLSWAHVIFDEAKHPRSPLGRFIFSHGHEQREPGGTIYGNVTHAVPREASSVKHYEIRPNLAYSQVHVTAVHESGKREDLGTHASRAEMQKTLVRHHDAHTEASTKPTGPGLIADDKQRALDALDSADIFAGQAGGDIDNDDNTPIDILREQTGNALQEAAAIIGKDHPAYQHIQDAMNAFDAEAVRDAVEKARQMLEGSG